MNLTKTELLTLARDLAFTKHQGQVDKGGNPYFGHPKRVAERVAAKGGSEQMQMCAYLHDVVEDTDVTFEQLARMGFPEEVVEGVRALTRMEGESYEEFIRRCGKNSIARQVKLADLEDNMDVSRLPGPLSDDDVIRLNKYLKAYHYLKG